MCTTAELRTFLLAFHLPLQRREPPQEQSLRIDRGHWRHLWRRTRGRGAEEIQRFVDVEAGEAGGLVEGGGLVGLLDAGFQLCRNPCQSYTCSGVHHPQCY